MLTFGYNMDKGDYLSTILRSTKTVFTSKDILLLWKDPGSIASRVRISYYIKKGDLYRIRKGFYAKNNNYSKLELATRIFTPSYVSFETVLAQEGLIFQTYNQIFIASYTTRELNVENQVYSYKKMKNSILTNSLGVNNVNEISIATKERAFLDTLYKYKDYHFDNLRSLNWDNIFQLLPMYENKRMNKVVEKLFKNHDS